MGLVFRLAARLGWLAIACFMVVGCTDGSRLSHRESCEKKVLALFDNERSDTATVLDECQSELPEFVFSSDSTLATATLLLVQVERSDALLGLRERIQEDFANKEQGVSFVAYVSVLPDDRKIPVLERICMGEISLMSSAAVKELRRCGDESGLKTMEEMLRRARNANARPHPGALKLIQRYAALTEAEFQKQYGRCRQW